jgi:hypothetical protein
VSTFLSTSDNPLGLSLIDHSGLPSARIRCLSSLLTSVEKRTREQVSQRSTARLSPIATVLRQTFRSGVSSPGAA